MPELPEVEITRRSLLPLVRGRKIFDFWTNWTRGFRSADSVKRIADSIRGRKILNVQRRGKVLFLELSGKPERLLAIHLRMSGRLEVTPRSARASRSAARAATEASSRAQRGISVSSPGKWTHFRWLLSGSRELRFIDPRKFGVVWYGSPAELARDPYLGRLGKEPHTINFETFSGILKTARGMVKPFLLRQDKFSGIGNIIADEALWRAWIHPQARIAYLGAQSCRRIFHGIRQTIRAMLASGGTTLRNWGPPDGSRGRFQEKRMVHGRAGSPCPRCRRKLVRIVVGGRGTTICPRCQPR